MFQDDFLEECRRWIGTPWRESGAQLGVGSHCIGYAFRAYAVIVERYERFDLKPMLIEGEPLLGRAVPNPPWDLYRFMLKHFDNLSPRNALPGDGLIYRTRGGDGAPKHFAVLSERNQVIQCGQLYGKVAETDPYADWQPIRAFRTREA